MERSSLLLINALGLVMNLYLFMYLLRYWLQRFRTSRSFTQTLLPQFPFLLAFLFFLFLQGVAFIHPENGVALVGLPIALLVSLRCLTLPSEHQWPTSYFIIGRFPMLSIILLVLGTLLTFLVSV
jgi:hypothetical protein